MVSKIFFSGARSQVNVTKESAETENSNLPKSCGDVAASYQNTPVASVVPNPNEHVHVPGDTSSPTQVPGDQI